MCSWCWGLRSVWQQVLQALPPEIELHYLLGGLAPDTDEPMPDEMREYIQATWRRIEEQVPGVRFNFDFWKQARPRRATWASCRAVISAGLQNPAMERPMVEAIQHAYYVEARNPSDNDTLIDVAAGLGLDTQVFAGDLDSPRVQKLLDEQIDLAREFGADSFPALVLEHGGEHRPVAHNYHDADRILAMIERARARMQS